jgi:hypothetical protein
METKTKTTIDMLTAESVSIRTQTFIEFNGEEKEIDNHRKAYINDENGRSELQSEQPEYVVNAVMAVWEA